MTRSGARLIGALAVTALTLAACSSGDDADTTPSTADATTAASATTGGAATAAPAAETTAGDSTVVTDAPPETAVDSMPVNSGGWAVDTADCVDPDRANSPIEGTVHIASAGPLSGGVAAAAFAPVIDGFKAYIDYANERGLLPGHDIAVEFGDDQFDAALTPGVIGAELDAGAHLVSGLLGTPGNLAVRDTLNEECIPQLMSATPDPSFGDVEDYPWTIGGLLPADIEARAYAQNIAAEFPTRATVAVFYVNTEAGVAFNDAFEQAADELNIDIVDTQTIDPADTAPPAGQLGSIGGEQPDAIVAIPLGAQCATFLNELSNQKATAAGWAPRVYLFSTCVSPLILSVAGANADGIYTSAAGGSVDIVNPDSHDLPGVAEYLAHMEAHGLADTVPTSAAGWTSAEVTVEILRQAAASPSGLTQASIIDAARNLDYAPSMARSGVRYKTSGDQDANLVEAVQLVQYDADTRFLTDVGPLIADFESS